MSHLYKCVEISVHCSGGGFGSVTLSDGVFLGDKHEGISHGYIECGYPGGFDVVSHNKLFVHEACKDQANEIFLEKFQSDWSRLQVHMVKEIKKGYYIG
jgi:hypothetical protein